MPAAATEPPCAYTLQTIPAHFPPFVRDQIRSYLSTRAGAPSTRSNRLREVEAAARHAAQRSQQVGGQAPEREQQVSDPVAKRVWERQAFSWERFYRRNGDKFFKDRHWIGHELFPAAHTGSGANDSPLLIELGCGVGNAAIPLLQEQPTLRYAGVDCSQTAVAALLDRADREGLAGRCRAAVSDLKATVTEETMAAAECPSDAYRVLAGLVKPDRPCASWASVDGGAGGCADMVLLMFTLSALHPRDFGLVAGTAAALLKPGGRLMFRDYHTGDLAQKRMHFRGKGLGDGCFARGDETTCYFFTELEMCEDIFSPARGFKKTLLNEVKRTVTNEKEKLGMDRSWIQAVFERV